MVRKLTLMGAAAAILMLAAALPAQAMRAAAELFAWDLRLRNAKTPKYGADLADGAALPVPAACLDEGGLPQWLPDWPLRVVSLDPGIIAAEMNVRGVMRLSIEPAVMPPAAGPPEAFAWDLQLRNTQTPKYGADMTSKEFAAWVAQKHRRVTIVDGATYKGASLKTLVGYFDDNNRQTFNATLAAKGYSVVITGFDGFAQTWASADIARLGDKVILADLADGAALPVPAAYLDGAGLPQWFPDWPLRVVSLDPGITAAEMDVGGSCVSASSRRRCRRE